VNALSIGIRIDGSLQPSVRTKADSSPCASTTAYRSAFAFFSDLGPNPLDHTQGILARKLIL
jgi:hypothetical protein